MKEEISKPKFYSIEKEGKPLLKETNSSVHALKSNGNSVNCNFSIYLCSRGEKKVICIHPNLQACKCK